MGHNNRAKNKIEEEGLYLNDSSSMTLFRCRTNTIKLNWHQRFQGGVVDCPVCESGAEETLRHFLKDCRRFGDIREIHGIREADEVEELLLFSDQDKKKIEKRKKYLEDLWKERKQQVRLRCDRVRERCGVARCEEGRTRKPQCCCKAILGTASDLWYFGPIGLCHRGRGA